MLFRDIVCVKHSSDDISKNRPILPAAGTDQHFKFLENGVVELDLGSSKDFDANGRLQKEIFLCFPCNDSCGKSFYFWVCDHESI